MLETYLYTPPYNTSYILLKVSPMLWIFCLSDSDSIFSIENKSKQAKQEHLLWERVYLKENTAIKGEI